MEDIKPFGSECVIKILVDFNKIELIEKDDKGHQNRIFFKL